jgi:hypothetical protein
MAFARIPDEGEREAFARVSFPLTGEIMNVGQRILAGGVVALGLIVAGCSSDHHDRASSERRSYDPYNSRYDARTAGSEHGPWHDDDRYLHHDRDWKADSDRGRDSNDRDDPSRRGY